jgi:hypothetical protein
LERQAYSAEPFSLDVMRFEETVFHEEFDGIWACASLLHIPSHHLSGVLNRMENALRPSGVLYISFKRGRGEWHRGGRYFNDATKQDAIDLLAGSEQLELIDLWQTEGSKDEDNINRVKVSSASKKDAFPPK